MVNRPAFVDALLQADTYPHACGTIDLIETHISWVFLTGDYAYKVKKPVLLNFVDFSTLERRAHFCREELRCNHAFAPELYDAVVPINFDGSRYQIGGDGETIEWAVRMVQFPGENQLDRLLEVGGLELAVLQTFGADLAEQHERLEVLKGDGRVAERILQPVLDNFHTLASLPVMRPHTERLDALRAHAVALFETLADSFEARLRGGFTRECHGDLHLSNLVLTARGVRAFDCLEFNPNLRWIDVASDVAFLLMDCCVRGRDDLAYGFLDGYLTGTGDYDGAVLSGFYQAYRSMVRAKVAALQLEQSAGQDADAARRTIMHLDWADKRLHRPMGGLTLMCGLSGSGKSFVAARLAPRIPAIRLRSDVARKRLAGLRPSDDSGSSVDAGLYTQANTNDVYAALLRWAEAIVGSGEHVIVDATFLRRQQRHEFVKLAARLGVRCAIVFCDAPRRVLDERLRRREREGGDVSEAGVEVLGAQLQRFEDFADEPVVRVDTATQLDAERLAKIRAAIMVAGDVAGDVLPQEGA